MAASISAHKNKNTKRPFNLSLSEIEAAKLLVQLSSGESEEDRRSNYSTSNNNSCSSYSVVQGKPYHSTGDAAASSSSSIAGIAEAEFEGDESFARRNKRYRYIEELYSVTIPLPAVKAKMMTKKIKR